MLATPSSCATVFKFSGLLWYFAVEVREITLIEHPPLLTSSKSHSERPRQNKRSTCSSLRLSKGNTAMLFSAITADSETCAAVIEVAGFARKNW